MKQWLDKNWLMEGHGHSRLNQMIGGIRNWKSNGRNFPQRIRLLQRDQLVIALARNTGIPPHLKGEQNG